MAVERKKRNSSNRGDFYARRFRALLEVYRKPDGTMWSASEIHRASDGELRNSYLSSLKHGGVSNPSHEKLTEIASVMGFNPSQWDLSDEEFEAYHNITLQPPPHGRDPVHYILRMIYALPPSERQRLIAGLKASERSTGEYFLK